MTINTVLALISVAVIVVGLFGLVAIEAYYRGWDKGFKEGGDIWRDYGDRVGKIWEEQYRELAERRGVLEREYRISH